MLPPFDQPRQVFGQRRAVAEDQHRRLRRADRAGAAHVVAEILLHGHHGEIECGFVKVAEQAVRPTKRVIVADFQFGNKGFEGFPQSFGDCLHRKFTAQQGDVPRELRVGACRGIGGQTADEGGHLLHVGDDVPHRQPQHVVEAVVAQRDDGTPEVERIENGAARRQPVAAGIVGEKDVVEWAVSRSKRSRGMKPFSGPATKRTSGQRAWSQNP